MKILKPIIFASFVPFMMSTVNASDLTPTNNLSLLQHQVMQYHASGAYTYDIQKVASKALNYLKMRISTNKTLKSPEKLALVLDIDETSLSNYHNSKQVDFGGTLSMHIAAEAQANDPAIMPTLRLYQYAKAHDVSVFFITGRDENLRQATIKNLVDAGFSAVKHSTSICENERVSAKCTLYLRDRKYRQGSAIPYKTAMRKKIEQAGYRIVVNIGDQYSDLAGGYSERIYKYPNYMYYIA